MLTAHDIARRVRSRARKLAVVTYPSGTFEFDDRCEVRLGTLGGRRYDVRVSPMPANYERPVGFDHIERHDRPTDQYMLACAFSKAIAGLARVDENLVADLEPIHKGGIASFVVTSRDDESYVVDVREVTPKMELEALHAFVAANPIADVENDDLDC